MWIYIINNLSYLLFLIAPFLYKSKRLIRTGFYRNMAMRFSCRKLYTISVFLILLSLHFYYLQVFQKPLDVMLSTVCFMLLFSHKNCEKVLRWLQSRYHITLAMLLSIMLLFIPHMFMMGTTIGVLIIAAVYYPSRLCMDYISEIFLRTSPYGNGLVGLYHKWDLMEKNDTDINDTEDTDRRLLPCKPECNPDTSHNFIEDADVIEYIDEDLETTLKVLAYPEIYIPLFTIKTEPKLLKTRTNDSKD